MPTGAVELSPGGTVKSIRPDVLQVLTESEADALLDLLPDASAVQTVFPYGFVVRTPAVTPNSRRLPVAEGTHDFDGLVTFAFKIPLQEQAGQDPFKMSIVFMLVEDSEVRITQSLEEQTPAGEAALTARISELSSGNTSVTVTLLGNSAAVISGHSVRRVCQVRIAGDANDPQAFLVNAGAGCSTATNLPDGVRVVDVDADGAGTGRNWNNAFPTLQDALECVRNNTGPGELCEGVNELWVAEGVYYPDEGTNITDNDQTATFSLVEGIEIYGGFAGSPSEYRRSQRDPEANVTILSGDIDGNDTNTDGNFIAETVGDIQGDNSFHVVTANGADGTPITRATLLDGFTITASYHSISNEKNGGGLLCDGSGAGGECSPTLRQLVFSGNAAKNGGAVFITTNNGGTAAPVFVDVIFRRNFAIYSGAGVVSVGDTDVATTVRPEFYNCEFLKNDSGEYGGGIFIKFAEAVVVNSSFWSNSGGTGGALSCLSLETESFCARLINVTIAGNRASGNNKGSAIYTYYGNLVLQNVIIWDNASPQSDAIRSLPLQAINVSNSILGDGCLPTNHFICTNVSNLNPLFVDAANGNLRLEGNSPANGLGSNGFLPTDDPYDLDGDGSTTETLPVDLAGNPRVVNDTVDAGAYENQ